MAAEARDPQQLVRTYSWEVEERLPPQSDAVVLGHVLGQEVRRESPWRMFFKADEAAQNSDK